MRLTRLSGVVIAGVLTAGCYTLQPTMGVSPEIGTEMAFDITDVGRVGLGPSMGPEIGQVEGRLVSRENAEYLVAVSNVKYLRGGEQPWKGEQVRLKSEYVGSTYQRHFSKSRTIALSAAGVAGAAFLLTRSLIGSARDETPAPPPIGTTIRVP
ncbi:MAG: hypothetical protein ABIT20_12275 [Gemmatimonadaceae bacterium]